MAAASVSVTLKRGVKQFLPFDRLRQTCLDLFGQPLSLGTLTQTHARAYQTLGPVEAAIMRALIQAPAVNVDESGLRVAGILHWLHVACTSDLTFYGVHGHRGAVAMDALGVLPHCRHWLVHDPWKPYYKYDARYKAIVRQGRRAHPRRKLGQGRTQQGKAANLPDRLEDYDLCVLAFLLDPNVPFTNNQGEQDIRMIKVKQKISGCFRTLRGAQVFARIRGYLSTCRKQGRNLWEACYQRVIGHPFMPNAPATGP